MNTKRRCLFAVLLTAVVSRHEAEDTGDDQYKTIERVTV